MRKLTIFAAGIIVAATVLLSTGVATGEPPQERSNAEEQVVLRLLYQPTAAAVEEYYGEHRQYWRQEVLNVQKVPESPYYEVVIRVETFHGAHNPPYGLDTMIFYIGPFDNIQLVNFDHQAEEDYSRWFSFQFHSLMLTSTIVLHHPNNGFQSVWRFSIFLSFCFSIQSNFHK